VIDVTNQESQGWMEKIIGLLDGGALSFDVNWIPEDPTQDYSTGLLYVFANSVVAPFQLIIPAATPVTWQFMAIIKTFTPDMPINGKLSVKVDMELTGKPTLA
jgi:hypothetical protein